MYILLQFLLLIFSLFLLERGADWLVDGSSSLAKRFNVSDLFIGLTIVAFGTSAPELAVSAAAALNHNGGIAIGNVVGSNVTNIGLVLGTTLLVGSMSLKKKTILYEIPLLIAAQLSATMLFLKDSNLDYHDGIVLLIFLVLFLIYAVSTSKKEGEEIKIESKQRSITFSILLTLAGLAGVTAGGEFGVYSAVNIARSFHVSETLIATTIVAFGTSVPELATSLKAALKKKEDLAMGNVIGSNMFNILGVLGLSAVLSKVKPDRNILGDLVFMNLLGVLLFFFFLNSKRSARRWKGVVLVGFYVAYILFGMITR